MEVRDASGTVIGANDNWQQNSQADQDALTSTGLAPTDPNEAALIGGLAPGPYTVIVRNSVENEVNSGIGLVEIYNLGTP